MREQSPPRIGDRPARLFRHQTSNQASQGPVIAKVIAGL